MKINNEGIEKQKNLGDDIKALKSKITEKRKSLEKMEMEFELAEKKIKGLKRYKISWMKFYNASGEIEIEATTEEEAIQIVTDNLVDYDGHFDGGPQEPFVESLGEVKDDPSDNWFSIQ